MVIYDPFLCHHFYLSKTNIPTDLKKNKKNPSNDQSPMTKAHIDHGLAFQETKFSIAIIHWSMKVCKIIAMIVCSSTLAILLIRRDVKYKERVKFISTEFKLSKIKITVR